MHSTPTTLLACTPRDSSRALQGNVRLWCGPQAFAEPCLRLAFLAALRPSSRVKPLQTMRRLPKPRDSETDYRTSRDDGPVTRSLLFQPVPEGRCSPSPCNLDYASLAPLVISPTQS